MPELPEVEVVRRDLENEILRRPILTAEVRQTSNAARIIRRHRGAKEFVDAVSGHDVRKVDRRGKYLLLHLMGDNTLVAHLGMSGQLILSPASRPMPGHTHVVLHLDRGEQLRYIDPRSFGEMFVASGGEAGQIAELRNLGMDPLRDQLGWQHFSATLTLRRMKLKSLLMDQRFISGIGNIYSDEILYAAGLRHDRSSATLTPSEARRLYLAIHEVLRAAIQHRGTSIEDEQYRDLYGDKGQFQQLLKVYQREGKPCLECGAPIERGRWSNRSTYYCPKCQR